MRLFVASDIHDDLEALATFSDFAAANGADRVVLLGDLGLRLYSAQDYAEFSGSNAEDAIPRFASRVSTLSSIIMQQMRNVLQGSEVPFTTIAGNYDGVGYGRTFADVDAQRNQLTWGDASVFGYGGADAYPPHLVQLANMNLLHPFDHVDLHRKLMIEGPDVLLVHNPPFGFCDRMFNGQHVGTWATRLYMAEYSPTLIMSGHIHEAGPNGNNPAGPERQKGVMQYSNPSSGAKTTIVNPGNLGRFEILNFPDLKTVREFDYGTFCRVDCEDNGAVTKVVQYSCMPDWRKVGRTIGPVRMLDEYSL